MVAAMLQCDILGRLCLLFVFLYWTIISIIKYGFSNFELHKNQSLLESKNIIFVFIYSELIYC